MSTLYRKRGRRYHPVHDTEAFEGLGNGSWLVVIGEGRRSARRLPEPTPALEQLSAMETLTELIVAELMAHHRARPAQEPLSEKERRAVKAYCDVMGPDAILRLTHPSAMEIAEKVAAALIRKLETTTDG